jgi:hypothetical protein
MKRTVFLILTIAGLVMTSRGVRAQQNPSELPRYEVGGDFTSLSLDSGTTLPGLGGRFTYNLNKHVALEAAGYFFPGKCEFCLGEATGQVSEGLFGIKAGHRFQKWGIFGKVRPGFAGFSRGAFNVTPLSTTGSGGQVNCFGTDPADPTACFRIESTRLTPLAIDLGGVLEFYPSKRVVVRFDAGDTILHYRTRTFNTLIGNPNNPAAVPTLVPFTAPARTRHSFQFMGGVGFRF